MATLAEVNTLPEEPITPPEVGEVINTNKVVEMVADVSPVTNLDIGHTNVGITPKMPKITRTMPQLNKLPQIEAEGEAEVMVEAEVLPEDHQGEATIIKMVPE